jgi:peptidoglycan/LPS O-acetylase OafA/YrhL
MPSDSRGPQANLDLLRSVAVLAVLLDHLVPTWRYCGLPVPAALLALTAHIGQAGVIAFFVHTSLVLMESLHRLAGGGRLGRGTVLRFYLRRILRIYPLAVLVITAVIVLDLPAMTWRDNPPLTPQVVLANQWLVQNLVTGRSVLGPLWSLPYEVQMYAVLPALYLLARWAQGPQWLAGLLGAAVLGAVVLGEFTGGRLNMAAYLPCFLCGVLAFALRQRGWAPRWGSGGWIGWLVVLFLGYAALHVGAEKPSPGLGWALAVALMVGILGFEDSRRPHLNALTQWIARYSYGLYLLHVPVLWLLFHRWGLQSLGLGLLAYLVLTTLAAVVAYHLVEAPMVALGQRLTQHAAVQPPPQPLQAVRPGKQEVPLPSAQLVDSDLWRLIHRH